MPKIILLADDSITIQKVVELTFSDADYEVIATNNGAKAIDKLAEIRPDIVLADIIMPEKNGYEVCEYVKSHPDFRNIPVILLTGTFEPFDPERAERAGCDAVVTKPFESQGLIQKVEDLIASREAQPAPSADVEEFPDEELADRPFDAVTQPNVPIPAIPDDFFDTPAEAPASDEIWSTETAEQAPAESFESPEEPATVLETEAAGIFEAPPQPSLPPVDESLIEESPFPAPPMAVQPLPFSEPAPFFESEPDAGDLFGSASDEIDTAVSPTPTPDEIFSAEEPSIFTESEPEPAPPVSTPSFDFGAETRAFNRDSFADLLPPRAPQEVEPPPPEPMPASASSVPDLFEESSFEDMPAEEPPVEEIETAAPLFGEQPSFSSTPFEEMEDSEPEPQAEEPLAMVAEPEPITDEPFTQEQPQFDEEEAIVDMSSVEAVAEPEPEPAFEHEPEPLALVPQPEPEIPTAMADFEPEPLALMSEPEPEPVALMPEPEPEPVAVLPELEPFEPEPFAPEPAPFEEMEPVVESQPLELELDESEPEELSEEALVEPEAPELAAAENEGMSAESLAPVAIPEAPAAAPVQPAGMTDADVERIAKRVVEMLSDRAIREIAWEVIPDLAESIVRDRIRELEREE